jgi:hypothetical protein
MDPRDCRGIGGLLQGMTDGEWECVLDIATQNGFAGLLGRNLAWAERDAGASVPIVPKLEAVQRGQLVQQLARKAAARRVAQALAEARIRFVVFKGIVLAEEIYGGLALRAFRDCDLMVPLDDLDRAFDVVSALGYSLTQFHHPREYLQLGAHAAGMLHRDGSGLDLHWSIAPDLLAPEELALAWAHCRPAPAHASVPGLRLSPEMTLVHLAKHFHSHQYVSVKPLLDFYVTARRLREDIDPAQVESLARGLGVLRVVEIAARLCERCFLPGTMPAVLPPRAPGLQARIARRTVTDDLMLSASKSPRIVNWLRYLAASGSFAAFRRSITQALVPGKLVLTQFFNRPYRSGMYPLYYWRQLVKVLTLSRS